MKRFILNTSLFVVPFFILYSLNVFLFNQHEGDLVRLGYLYSNPSPRSEIINQYALPRKYKLLTGIDLSSKTKFDVITIGDSFSEQGSLGYNNFLARKGISVLHVNRFISSYYPIQTLIQLLNSNFFDNVKADYIVLQSIERVFNQRLQKIDFNKNIDLDSILNINRCRKMEESDNNLPFFSNATLKIPLTNIQYLFDVKPMFSQTYKFKSTSSGLFSNSPDDLLFFKNDINNLNVKNDSLYILESVKILDSISNLVSKINAKLIVLVSPDKYDLYYQFIKYKEGLVEPAFFSIYDNEEKHYLNVNSYQIFSEKIKNEKDIYFYDDTHWAPKGAEIIADELFNMIKK